MSQINTESSSCSPSPDEVESNLHTQIRNIGIPPRPALLINIEQEMRKDEPDSKHMADMIGADVGLSASVIKVANSPFFGFGKQVRSVSEAMLVVGLKMIVHTIAAHALRMTFPHVPSLERFWDAASQTAQLAGWLALRLKGRTRVRPEEAYTFGLFRDCGIPVLMIPFPEYAQILMQANAATDKSFTDIEDGLLSINHAIVGAELAEDWGLPEELYQAIRYHHDSSILDVQEAAQLRRDMQHMIAIGQIAEYLLQTRTGLSQTQEWSKFGEVCLRQFEIDADELEALLNESRDALVGLS